MLSVRGEWQVRGKALGPETGGGASPRSTADLRDLLQVTSLCLSSFTYKMVTGTSLCRIIVTMRVNTPKYAKCLAHSKLTVSGSLAVETNTKSLGHGDAGSAHNDGLNHQLGISPNHTQ